MDEVLVALAVGQLDEAQPVAAGDEAHGFGVDGDRPVGERDLGGQVLLVQVNGHSISIPEVPKRFSPPRAPVATPGALERLF